jgi:Flp pilus assembly pilin Flp
VRRAPLRSESGQTIPEYALLIAGIVVVLLVSLLFAGGKATMSSVHRHRSPQEPCGRRA